MIFSTSCGAGSGQGQERGRQVQVGRKRARGLSPGDFRMHDEQGHVDVFLIGKGSLAPQVVAAAHLPMVRGKDDHGIFPHPLPFQLVEHGADLHVHVFQAVQVIVFVPGPMRIRIRYRPHHVIPALMVFVMRFGAAFFGNGLVQIRRQREILMHGLIHGVVRRSVDLVHELAGLLLALSARVRIEIHDIMRIDEIDGQEERRALFIQARPFCAQPVHGITDKARIVGISSQRAPVMVSGRVEIGKIHRVPWRRSSACALYCAQGSGPR